MTNNHRRSRGHHSKDPAVRRNERRSESTQVCRETEWQDEVCNQEDDFRDYMKSQKARRDRRRTLGSGSTAKFALSNARPQASFRLSPDTPRHTLRKGRRITGITSEENNTTLEEGKQEGTEPRGLGPQRRRRNVRRQTMDALQVLGLHQAIQSEEWQNGFSSASHHTRANLSRSPSHLSLESVYEDSSSGSDEDTFQSSKVIPASANSQAYSQDHHKHDDHHSHHQLMLPWYCSPVQRQLWDDDQVLPHVNWHDLFFDLIFVAAAYNLGGMLISAMSKDDWPRGVVYFIGIFGPLYLIWENDVIYASRYTLVDYSHRILAVLRFLCVSFAVLSIKPLDLVGDKHSAETFVFVFSLFCESLVQLGLNLELYLYGDGDRKAIQNQTKRETIYHILPTSLTYLAATVVAGWSYSQQDRSTVHGGFGSSNGTEAANYDPFSSTGRDTSSYGDSSETSASSDQPYRFLEESDYGSSYGSYKPQGVQWSIADVPMFLCLGIYVFNLLLALFQRSSHSKKIRDIREHFVPNNIDYMIHRYGEWIMLMIGESILSLLIVETTESQEYYLITGLGCLTVIILQMLKFESQPAHADGHALWRSMTAATLYSILLQVLSMSLVAFGVSYKLMLKAVIKEEASSDSYDDHRRLASSYYVSSEANIWLFCVSLSVILITLELMMGTHQGIAETYNIFFRMTPEAPQPWSLNWPIITITVIKVGIIAFTATLGLLETDIFHIAITGFLIVTAMAFIHITGWGFTHHEEYINSAINDAGRSMTAFVMKASQSLDEELDATALDDSGSSSKRRGSLKHPSKLTSDEPDPVDEEKQRSIAQLHAVRAKGTSFIPRVEIQHNCEVHEPSSKSSCKKRTEAALTSIGWIEYLDAESGKNYYADRHGNTTWQKPAKGKIETAIIPRSSPHGTTNNLQKSSKTVWKSTTDNVTGEIYYYHVKTRRTTWTNPYISESTSSPDAITEAPSHA